MELSITGATGFFGSEVARERGGRDIRVNPVAPGAGSIVTAIWNALGSQRKPPKNGRSKLRQKYR
jgi:hypothetical protein